MEPFTEADWKLEHASIRSKDNDVSRRIEYGGANLAVLKMPLHNCAHVRWEGVVEEIGDAIPHILAMDYHVSHLRFGCNCFSCGARPFWSNSLAR
jgi:hypothetical protein